MEARITHLLDDEPSEAMGYKDDGLVRGRPVPLVSQVAQPSQNTPGVIPNAGDRSVLVDVGAVAERRDPDSRQLLRAKVPWPALASTVV